MVIYTKNTIDNYLLYMPLLLA